MEELLEEFFGELGKGILRKSGEVSPEIQGRIPITNVAVNSDKFSWWNPRGHPRVVSLENFHDRIFERIFSRILKGGSEKMPNKFLE